MLDDFAAHVGQLTRGHTPDVTDGAPATRSGATNCLRSGATEDLRRGRIPRLDDAVEIEGQEPDWGVVQDGLEMRPALAGFLHRSLEAGQVRDEYHSRPRIPTVEGYSLKKHWKDRPV